MQQEEVAGEQVALQLKICENWYFEKCNQTDKYN